MFSHFGCEINNLKLIITFVLKENIQKIDLYYLKNVKPYDEELSKEIEMRITPCSESENDEKVKSNIQYQVNKNTKYKYPHQERMREVFG